MAIEALKYRSENIQPDQFMRPPTEPFQAEAVLLSLDLEERINRRANDAVAVHSSQFETDEEEGMQVAPPILKVGSELEILLFSPDSDPGYDLALPQSQNPNYDEGHLQRVRDVAFSIVNVSNTDSLGDVLQDDIDFSRIFMEIRSKAGSVGDYFRAMGKVKDWFQGNGKGLRVNPAVFSQHIHLSLYSETMGINLLDEERGYSADIRHILNETQARTIPLLRLPEEVEGEDVFRIGVDGGSLVKGWTGVFDPRRIEARMNSSEYAFDPYINMLVNLIAIYRGVVRIDPEGVGIIRTVAERVKHPSRYWTYGGDDAKWETELDLMQRDELMHYFMPGNLLKRISRVLEEYWDISRGIRTVEEVRDKASD